MKRLAFHFLGAAPLSVELPAGDADGLLEQLESQPDTPGILTFQKGATQYVVRRSAIAFVEVCAGREARA